MVLINNRRKLFRVYLMSHLFTTHGVSLSLYILFTIGRELMPLLRKAYRQVGRLGRLLSTKPQQVVVLNPDKPDKIRLVNPLQKLLNMGAPVASITSQPATSIVTIMHQSVDSGVVNAVPRPNAHALMNAQAMSTAASVAKSLQLIQANRAGKSLVAADPAKRGGETLTATEHAVTVRPAMSTKQQVDLNDGLVAEETRRKRTCEGPYLRLAAILAYQQFLQAHHAAATHMVNCGCGTVMRELPEADALFA